VAGQVSRLLHLTESGSSLEAATLLESPIPLQALVEISENPEIRISARRWLEECLVGVSPRSLRPLEDYFRLRLESPGLNEDWRALRDLRFRCPLPGLLPEIDTMIGDRFLDAGMPALASLHYWAARRSDGKTAEALLEAKYRYSSALAGTDVDGEVPGGLSVMVAGKEEALNDLVTEWSGSVLPAREAGSPVDFPNADMTRLPLASAPAVLFDWQLRWIARQGKHTFPFTDEFVPVRPSGSSRLVVANTGTSIEAFDPVTCHRLWEFTAPEENAMAFSHQGERDHVECARTAEAVVSGDRVFCNLVWGHHDSERHAGATFALRAEDGSVLWSTTGAPELAGLAAAGEPAVRNGVVVTLAWNPFETVPVYYVAGLSAETGEVLWLTHLSSGSSLTVIEDREFLFRPFAAGAPAIKDGVAYINTGAGVIAAVSVIDGSIVWAQTYPRVEVVRDVPWTLRLAVSRPAGIVAPFDDVVLFAPLDCQYLIGVDPVSGEIRFMREDLDLRAISAADSERAYVLRNTSIRAVRPDDGETVWERTFPVSGIVGLPTLSERGLWCPAWEGLFLVDAASGDVESERSWERNDACGFILDLGERLVGASRLAVHTIGATLTVGDGGTRLSPESATSMVRVTVPTRADAWLRWALPTVDGGDAVMSRADDDRFVTRSDLLRMWSLRPVPSLVWERASPMPWRCAIEFDRDRVAVWDRGRVVVLDAGTGRTLWQDRMPDGAPEDEGRRVALAGDAILTWGDHEVRCSDVASGGSRWTHRTRGRVVGCVLTDRGIAVYSEGSPCSAALLDWDSGELLTRVEIPDMEPRPRPAPPEGRRPPQLARVPRLLVGQVDAGKTAPAADIVLVNGVAPVRIDWERGEAVAGEPIETPVRGVGFGYTFEVYDTCIGLRGRTDDWVHYNEPLIALWDRESLTRISVPPADRWHVHGDRLYSFFGHRAVATDLGTRQRLWQSRPLKDRCRMMMATEEDIVLVNQRGWFGKDDGREVSSFRILDAETGEIIEHIRLPKGWIHLLDQQPGRILAWDIAYLYDIEPPDESEETVLEEYMMPPEDADTITALRVGRDLEKPPEVEVPLLDEQPVIDGSLEDWYPVEPLRLDSVMDWKPDFALRTRGGIRIPAGKEDASAVVYLGRTEGSILAGIEVMDDVHVSDPRPGLWRGDAVTLWWAHGGGETTDPRMLTVALSGGVPRYELGTAVRARAVSDPPGQRPAPLPGPRSFLVPSFGGIPAGNTASGGRLEVAIRRDETSRSTVYEMRIPSDVWPVDEEGYWDIVIHDNDGQGREGGLQPASSLWAIEETAIGAIPGKPAEE
jgi:outer membrane protein assembly factor BamB